MDDLKAFLDQRGLTHAAAGIVGDVNGSTISRICTGQRRARPETIVKLARALGVGAKRMQRMCDAHYFAAHPDEDPRTVTGTRETVSAS